MHERKLNKLSATIGHNMQIKDESDVTERYSIEPVDGDKTTNEDIFRIPIESTSTVSSVERKIGSLSEGSTLSETTPNV